MQNNFSQYSEKFLSLQEPEELSPYLLVSWLINYPYGE